MWTIVCTFIIQYIENLAFCILHFPAIFSMNFSPPPISPLAKYANSENIDSVLSPRHTGNATLRPGCNKCMFKFMDEVTSWLPV